MTQLQTEEMSNAERDFLRAASASDKLWKALLAVGILFGLAGIVATAARLVFQNTDVGSEGSMMFVAGLFMVLYANLLHGARDYLKRNGLLDEARRLKRRPAT